MFVLSLINVWSYFWGKTIYFNYFKSLSLGEVLLNFSFESTAKLFAFFLYFILSVSIFSRFCKKMTSPYATAKRSQRTVFIYGDVSVKTFSTGQNGPNLTIDNIFWVGMDLARVP